MVCVFLGGYGGGSGGGGGAGAGADAQLLAAQAVSEHKTDSPADIVQTASVVPAREHLAGWLCICLRVCMAGCLPASSCALAARHLTVILTSSEHRSVSHTVCLGCGPQVRAGAGAAERGVQEEGR